MATPPLKFEVSSPETGQKLLDRRSFGPNATIFAEDQPGTIAYILLSGDVAIVRGRGTAQERELTQIQAGQIFGELALMAGDRRTATAITRNGCDVLVVHQERFKQKLDEADPFIRYWIDYLSRRVIELSSR